MLQSYGLFGTYEIVSAFMAKSGEAWKLKVSCKCAGMMRRWKVLIKLDKLEEVEGFTGLERRGAGPVRIAWSSSPPAPISSLGASPSRLSQSGSKDVANVGMGGFVCDPTNLYIVPMNTHVELASVNLSDSLERG